MAKTTKVRYRGDLPLPERPPMVEEKKSMSYNYNPDRKTPEGNAKLRRHVEKFLQDMDTFVESNESDRRTGNQPTMSYTFTPNDLQRLQFMLEQFHLDLETEAAQLLAQRARPKPVGA